MPRCERRAVNEAMVGGIQPAGHVRYAGPPRRALHLPSGRNGLRVFGRADGAMFVALSALHGTVLLAMPVVPVIAIGIWWNSNTIAHNAIHRPFFRSRPLDLGFSAYQSVLLGIPQTIYRERHLAHHAGAAWWPRLSAWLLVEAMLVLALWATLASLAPSFFLFTYAPGYLLGLALCALQGHYEHAGGTTSHYGRLYNVVFFNDGYHVEHHAAPGVGWSELPRRRQPGARASRWPALLRWVDRGAPAGLEALEAVVLRLPPLQWLMVAVHRRAFRRMLRALGPIRRAVIVGGGLFPRTAIVLHRLVPAADLVVVDASARNLAAARSWLARHGREVERTVTFRHERFTDGQAELDADLLVIPLAYQGDRAAIYARPPARAVLVHDWIWNARGESCVISRLLLKRLNLVPGVRS